MKVLLDQNTPLGLRKLLPAHTVSHAYEMNWDRLENGELLAEAERAAFDVFLSCDQNIAYQQNIRERRIAVVLLSTNRWDLLKAAKELIESAVATAKAGDFRFVECGRFRPRRSPR